MKTAGALFVLALVSAALVACGGDAGPVTAGTIEEEPEEFPGDLGQWVVEFEADPDGDLAYTFDEVVSPPGNTNFLLRNPQSVGHDVAIETIGGQQLYKTEIVKDEEDLGWMRLSMKAGEYVFYCSVPGHREAGMEGTLTVQ